MRAKVVGRGSLAEMEALCEELEGVLDDGVSTDNLVDAIRSNQEKKQHSQGMERFHCIFSCKRVSTNTLSSSVRLCNSERL